MSLGGTPQPHLRRLVHCVSLAFLVCLAMPVPTHASRDGQERPQASPRPTIQGVVRSRLASTRQGLHPGTTAARESPHTRVWGAVVSTQPSRVRLTSLCAERGGGDRTPRPSTSRHSHLAAIARCFRILSGRSQKTCGGFAQCKYRCLYGRQPSSRARGDHARYCNSPTWAATVVAAAAVVVASQRSQSESSPSGRSARRSARPPQRLRAGSGTVRDFIDVTHAEEATHAEPHHHVVVPV